MRRAQLVLKRSSRAAESSGAALRSRTSLRLDSSSSSNTRILEIQGSRCITIGSTSNFVSRAARDCNSLTAYSTSFQYVRYHSTNAPQPSIVTSSTIDPLPPVISKGKEKAKVELRPGPAKPATPSSPAAQQKSTTTTKPSSQTPESISKPHPTKPPPVSATSKTDVVLKEEENSSIIEIAKKDVEIAAQHGILAPPPPDAGFARKLFHQAKELFKFYWAGMKLIPANRREVLKIQERVKSGGAPMTWREHRFIVTNKSDLFKLVPFVLIVVIIEEIIPLIVMYAPGMLPSTCVLPSQRARIDAKRHTRQREVYEIVKELPFFSDHNAQEVSLNSFDFDETKILCKGIGLGYYGLHSSLRRRLRNYLRAIAEDDALLLAEGKGARLKQDEIAEALWERGILADAFSAVEQRNRLRWWLDTVKAAPSDIPPEDVRIQLYLKMLQQYKSSSPSS